MTGKLSIQKASRFKGKFRGLSFGLSWRPWINRHQSRFDIFLLSDSTVNGITVRKTALSIISISSHTRESQMADPQRRPFLSDQPLDYEIATESAVLRESVIRQALRRDEQETHHGDVIDGIRNAVIVSGLFWLVLFAVARYGFNLV
jgi:hypothetical protein